MEGRGRGPGRTYDELPLPVRATAMTYTELLAMRELSVDAYWEEQRDPRRRPPSELDIPVPLWPGESRQQFECEFYRWLSSRRLSPAAMREDPKIERKWRRQFAQTRAARPQRLEGKGSQRSPSPRTPRSPPPLRRPNGVQRSRSRSRSPSPLRRFNGVQQPQRAYPGRREDNRAYAPSFERRPSPDRGRPFSVRQPGDRQQHERSYSRERPRAPPPESPRSYTNRQTSDPRRHLDARAPSPRSIYRQHVSAGQRWSKSPSRSPPYSRAPSPSQSDRSPSQLGRPASAPFTDTLRKQLLARRVISVEAFRDEMYKLRQGFIREDDLKRPREAMVRIPILLWTGESMGQYTQKFERWLDSRNIPLSSLRDYPAKERLLWHSFAYTRAGMSDFAEPGRPSDRPRSPPPIRRSRSRSRSPSRSMRRSSEQGRPPMPATYLEDRPLKKGSAPNGAYMLPVRDHSEQQQRPNSPPSTTAPPENPRLYNNKTRRQLLERRIVSLEAFQKEVEGVRSADVTGDNLLPAIPVPLHPGESMGLFDHRFWTWLTDYNETKDSLRGNPARERRFRMAFAHVRVSRPHTSTKAGSPTTGAQGFRPSVDSHAKIPLGVLKSARARLGMNAKRVADDDSERDVHPQYLRDEPDSKRARIDAEGKSRDHGISELPSSRLLANAAQKRSPTAPILTSSQATSRATVASATTVSSARPLISAAAVTFGSVRSSMSSRPSAVPDSVKMRSPPSLIAPGSRKPIPIIPKSKTPQTEPATPAAPVRTTKPANAMSKSPAGAPAPLQPSASLQKIMPRREKAAEEATASQSSSAPLQKIRPRPEETASSRDKPVNSQAAPRSLMPAWHKRVSESTPSTPSPVFVVQSASSSASASPAAEISRNRLAGASRNGSTPAAAGVSRRSSPSADRPTASATPEKSTTGVDAIQQDLQSEPSATPADSAEMSDADSNPADESEEHDGDVMNADGCCCSKCMRSWARTLTDRMDELEQNVLDLKQEVGTRTGGQPAPVTCSSS